MLAVHAFLAGCAPACRCVFLTSISVCLNLLHAALQPLASLCLSVCIFSFKTVFNTQFLFHLLFPSRTLSLACSLLTPSSQEWSGIFDILAPFPEQGASDEVTAAMREQNYTAADMHRLSESFYASLGLGRLPYTFWSLSMLTKPAPPTQAVCHASAWDLNAKGVADLRIKMCTEVTASGRHDVCACAYVWCVRIYACSDLCVRFDSRNDLCVGVYSRLSYTLVW